MQPKRQGNSQLSRNIQSELKRRWVKFTSDNYVFAPGQARAGEFRPINVVVRLSRDATIRYYPHGSLQSYGLSFGPEYQSDLHVLRYLIEKFFFPDQKEVNGTMTLYVDDRSRNCWLQIYNAVFPYNHSVSFTIDEIEFLKHHLGNKMDVFQSLRNTANGLAGKQFTSRLSSSSILKYFYKVLHEDKTKINDFFYHQEGALATHDEQQTYDLITRLNSAIAQLSRKT
jgi:hypothetical protein